MENSNNRKYFRLAYPVEMMAKIIINGDEYPVSEISEGGLRVRCTQFRQFKVGDEVEAMIIFHDGSSVPIAGVVYRRDVKDYIIAPLEGISFKLIVNEQRRLLRQFPSTRNS